MLATLIIASHKQWLETGTVRGSFGSVGKWQGCTEHVWNELGGNFFKIFLPFTDLD
jgi:hypothetical protein